MQRGKHLITHLAHRLDRALFFLVELALQVFASVIFHLDRIVADPLDVRDLMIISAQRDACLIADLHAHRFGDIIRDFFVESVHCLFTLEDLFADLAVIFQQLVKALLHILLCQFDHMRDLRIHLLQRDGRSSDGLRVRRQRLEVLQYFRSHLLLHRQDLLGQRSEICAKRQQQQRGDHIEQRVHVGNLRGWIARCP